jgi:hypothetical protein
MSTANQIKNFIQAGEGTPVLNEEKELKINFPQKNTGPNIFQRAVKNKTGFLIIPVLMFELFVCIQSYNYYHNTLFFSSLGALSIALCVESFYMLFSSRKGPFKETVMKYLLLAISIFTLAYSTYSRDENLIAFKEGIETSKVKLSLKLGQLEKQVELNNKEREQIDQQMSVYIQRELITKGNRVLAPRRKEIDSNIKSLLKEQEAIRLQLASVSESTASIPLIKQMELLTIKTMITIIVFALIQIAICVSLSEIVSALTIPHKNTER